MIYISFIFYMFGLYFLYLGIIIFLNSNEDYTRYRNDLLNPEDADENDVITSISIDKETGIISFNKKLSAGATKRFLNKTSFK